MSKTPFSFLSLRMGGAILGLLLGTLLLALPCEALTLHHPLGPSLLAATGILDRSSLGSVPLVLRPWRSLEEAGAVLAKEPGGLAVLPTTTAAFLAERGIPLHLLGVHLWKAFFLLSSRENPLKDLSAAGGTRILVPFGRGDVADGVLRTLLKASSVRNVKLLYASPQEGVALLAAGKIDGAVLPEPFATLARRGGAHALDLQVEWARRFGGRPRLPVTGLFRVGTLDPATEQAAVAAFQRSVARALRDPQGAGAVAAETLHMEPALVREAGRRLTLEFVPPRAAAPGAAAVLPDPLPPRPGDPAPDPRPGPGPPLSMRTAGVLGLLALWQGAAVLLGPRGRLILPPPRAVLERLFTLGAEGAFWADGGRTLLEVSAALGLILGLGLFLGVALGASRRLDALCEPALALLQATPVVSWLALAVFAFGIGWRGPVLLTTLNLLPLATLTVRSGFRSVDGELLEMARVFRVPRGRVLARIVLPSLRPFLGAALDVAAPGAWKAVLVTEYLCGDGGWGVRLAWARQTVDTPALYAVTLAAVLGGWGFERLLRRLGRRFSC